MNAIWIAVAAVSLLGLAFGAILGYASRRFAVDTFICMLCLDIYIKKQVIEAILDKRPKTK